LSRAPLHIAQVPVKTGIKARPSRTIAFGRIGLERAGREAIESCSDSQFAGHALTASACELEAMRDFG
jgi:hypothetical protein